jgi:hypothetical protein
MVFTDTVLVDINLSKNLDLEQIYNFNQKFFQKKVVITKTVFPTQLKFKQFLWQCNWYMEKTPSNSDLYQLFFYNNIEESQYFFTETLQYLINDYFIPNKIHLNGHIWGRDGIFNEPFEIYVKDNILIGSF